MNGNKTPGVKGFSPDSLPLVEKFLATQEKEIELKNQQHELEKQRDVNSFEFAKKSLEAQVADRDKQRTYQLVNRRNGMIFATIVCVLLTALIGIALYLNKDQVVQSIIQAILYFATGGTSGYVIGRYKGAQDKSMILPSQAVPAKDTK